MDIELAVSAARQRQARQPDAAVAGLSRYPGRCCMKCCGGAQRWCVRRQLSRHCCSPARDSLRPTLVTTPHCINAWTLPFKTTLFSPTYNRLYCDTYHWSGLPQPFVIWRVLQISGHPVIAPHLTKMFGIRNGIDQELWDPSIDEHLPQNFGPEDVVQGKAAAKRELRRRGNLADVDVPLVSSNQKAAGHCCRPLHCMLHVLLADVTPAACCVLSSHACLACASAAVV
eukprot:GHRQ01031377.1.p1 GENE.GHRQ01031377.1~~GHRQ01031377.1.p1  ORF type:complete len:228 (-),score=45.35 GHRQ01031377.1:143-826(-)